MSCLQDEITFLLWGQLTYTLIREHITNRSVVNGTVRIETAEVLFIVTNFSLKKFDTAKFQGISWIEEEILLIIS